MRKGDKGKSYGVRDVQYVNQWYVIRIEGAVALKNHKYDNVQTCVLCVPFANVGGTMYVLAREWQSTSRTSQVRAIPSRVIGGGTTKNVRDVPQARPILLSRRHRRTLSAPCAASPKLFEAHTAADPAGDWKRGGGHTRRSWAMKAGS